MLKAIKNKQPSNENEAENEDGENPDDIQDESPKRRQKRKVIEGLIEISGVAKKNKRTDNRVVSEEARSEGQESEIAPEITTAITLAPEIPMEIPEIPLEIPEIPMEIPEESNKAEEDEVSNTAPKSAPETATETAPQTAPEIAPKTTPEIAPETASEQAPEETPKTAPEIPMDLLAEVNFVNDGSKADKSQDISADLSISLDSPNSKQAMTKVKDKTRRTRNDKDDVQEQIILDPAAENQNPKSSNQNQKKSKSKRLVTFSIIFMSSVTSAPFKIFSLFFYFLQSCYIIHIPTYFILKKEYFPWKLFAEMRYDKMLSVCFSELKQRV